MAMNKYYVYQLPSHRHPTYYQYEKERLRLHQVNTRLYSARTIVTGYFHFSLELWHIIIQTNLLF